MRNSVKKLSVRRLSPDIHICRERNRFQAERRVLQQAESHLFQRRGGKFFRYPQDFLCNIGIGQRRIRQRLRCSPARFHTAFQLLFAVLSHILENQRRQLLEKCRYLFGPNPGLAGQSVISVTQGLKCFLMLRQRPGDGQACLKRRDTGFIGSVLHCFDNQESGRYLIRALCDGSHAFQNLLNPPGNLFRFGGRKFPELRIH